jgi:hypothetical protein
VGSPAVLDTVVKRKIPSPHRESKPRTPIVQPVAQILKKREGKRKIEKYEKYKLMSKKIL